MGHTKGKTCRHTPLCYGQRLHWLPDLHIAIGFKCVIMGAYTESDNPLCQESVTHTSTLVLNQSSYVPRYT